MKIQTYFNTPFLSLSLLLILTATRAQLISPVEIIFVKFESKQTSKIRNTQIECYCNRFLTWYKHKSKSTIIKPSYVYLS